MITPEDFTFQCAGAAEVSKLSVCSFLVSQNFSRHNLDLSKGKRINCVCSCTPCTPGSAGPVYYLKYMRKRTVLVSHGLLLPMQKLKLPGSSKTFKNDLYTKIRNFYSANDFWWLFWHSLGFNFLFHNSLIIPRDWNKSDRPFSYVSVKS